MAMWSQAQKADKPDWKVINEAILSKYTISGLEWIKRRAWGILEGKIDPTLP